MLVVSRSYEYEERLTHNIQYKSMGRPVLHAHDTGGVPHVYAATSTAHSTQHIVYEHVQSCHILSSGSQTPDVSCAHVSIWHSAAANGDACAPQVLAMYMCVCGLRKSSSSCSLLPCDSRSFAASRGRVKCYVPIWAHRRSGHS